LRVAGRESGPGQPRTGRANDAATEFQSLWHALVKRKKAAAPLLHKRQPSAAEAYAGAVL